VSLGYVFDIISNNFGKGVIEISDMLFTVQGATAGAILVEWNVHESTQGSSKSSTEPESNSITQLVSAGMWDSHFRVGGAIGSDLQLDNCPKLVGFIPECMAASLLLHLTPESSGYFENV
jgi:glucan 1,3-beta-glucosidase